MFTPGYASDFIGLTYRPGYTNIKLALLDEIEALKIYSTCVYSISLPDTAESDDVLPQLLHPGYGTDHGDCRDLSSWLLRSTGLCLHHTRRTCDYQSPQTGVSHPLYFSLLFRGSLLASIHWTKGLGHQPQNCHIRPLDWMPPGDIILGLLPIFLARKLHMEYSNESQRRLYSGVRSM